MAWPDAAAFAAYLESIGIEPGAGAEGSLEAMVARFEEETGWYPFFAAGSSSRTFRGGEFTRLWIDGCLSVSSVAVDGSDAIETDAYAAVTRLIGSRSGGTVYALDRLDGYGWGSFGSQVAVTATWGAFADGDPTAELAVAGVLAGAAADFLAAGSGSSGEVSEVKQGPVTIKYGQSSSAVATGLAPGRHAALAGRYESAVRAYRRPGN